jgi:beta-phosphoglucomutase
MDWITYYQLFLFDFDGLLVNTEYLHYKAYIEMCAQRGYTLTWDFTRYSQAAHHGAHDLRDQIYNEFPRLQKEEPNWNILYEAKKNLFIHFLLQQTVPLMPGVAELLAALQKANILHCVVTHSTKTLTDQIRSHQPILNSIPHWITREDYTQAKPHPECYQMAIDRYAKPTDHVIGFEDSPRGIHALGQTRAKAVLICPPDMEYLPKIRKSFPYYYPTFTSITNQNAP